MRRIFVAAVLFAICFSCFAETDHITLHLKAYVPPRAEVAWNGEEPVVVSNFNESATATIEEWSGYQVVTFTAA